MLFFNLNQLFLLIIINHLEIKHLYKNRVQCRIVVVQKKRRSGKTCDETLANTEPVRNAFLKLHKLAPVGAPLLKKKAKLLYFIIRVSSTSFLVNLCSLNETLLDGERTCICYDQRQYMLNLIECRHFLKHAPITTLVQ